MYSSIILETLIPDSLPGAALFLKHGPKHVLYKGPNLPFTERDKQRLAYGNVQRLYVYSSEISYYNKYVEANLSQLLANEDLSIYKRQEILCQASISYVQEIFDAPAINIRHSFDRCNNLIRYILSDIFTPQQILSTLGNLIKHNCYTYVHSIQVTSYMASLFKVMNEAEDIITDIALGAIFHDYGKVYVPRTILDNPYKLSAKEFAEIKTHSDRGHYALYDLVILNPVSLDIIRHHHEKIDGTGYPDGLSDEISKYARIASISDAFSALTTNRSYRKALPKEEALDIMYNQMKGAFDAFYLSMFASMLDEG